MGVRIQHNDQVHPPPLSPGWPAHDPTCSPPSTLLLLLPLPTFSKPNSASMRVAYLGGSVVSLGATPHTGPARSVLVQKCLTALCDMCWPKGALGLWPKLVANSALFHLLVEIHSPVLIIFFLYLGIYTCPLRISLHASDKVDCSSQMHVLK